MTEGPRCCQPHDRLCVRRVTASTRVKAYYARMTARRLTWRAARGIVPPIELHVLDTPRDESDASQGRARGTAFPQVRGGVRAARERGAVRQRRHRGLFLLWREQDGALP